MSALLFLLAVFAAVVAIPALIVLLVVVLSKREYSAGPGKRIPMAWKIGLAYLVGYMALFLMVEWQLAIESINRFYFPSSTASQPDFWSVAAHWLRPVLGIPIPLLANLIADAVSVRLSMPQNLLLHLANGVFLAYLAASASLCLLKLKERRAKNHGP